MTQLKLCACDVPGCTNTARVPELGTGNIRGPLDWSEIRVFPPTKKGELTVHVCQACYESVIVPLFGEALERDRQRLDDIAHQAATGVIPMMGNAPAWLSGTDVAKLMAGQRVELDAELTDEEEEIAKDNARKILQRAVELFLETKPAGTWEELPKKERREFVRAALDEFKTKASAALLPASG